VGERVLVSYSSDRFQLGRCRGTLIDFILEGLYNVVELLRLKMFDNLKDYISITE
jgi:hypothetical protein